MKVDLVKLLQENELYQAALKSLSEEERGRAKMQIESQMSELTKIVQAFVDHVQMSDDDTKRDLKTAVEGADVVIDEITLTSGSHG